MQHYIVHHGHVGVSLAAPQRGYIDDDFMQGVNDPEVTAGVLLRPPVLIEQEYAWYEGLPKNKEQVIFMIVEHAPSEEDRYRNIGHTGIHKISWPAGVGNTGSLIWRKELFQKGHGTEAKILLLYHAFYVLGLRKITSEVKVFNARSLGHLLKTGYAIVGRRREQHFHQGSYVDELLLEVFREDFEPVWEAYNETKSLPSLTEEQREIIKKETTT